MDEFVCTTNQVTDFILSRETEAEFLYKKLASMFPGTYRQKFFSQMAAEENQHSNLVKDPDFNLKDFGDNFYIDQYYVDLGFTSDMGMAEIFILSMEKEKAAFQLYHDLIKFAADDYSKKKLLWLSEQEARHKVMLEIEYDKLP